MDDEQRVIDDIVGGFDAHLASMLRDAMHRAYDVGFRAGWAEHKRVQRGVKETTGSYGKEEG